MGDNISLIIGSGLIGTSLKNTIPKTNEVIVTHHDSSKKNNKNEIFLDLKNISEFVCPKGVRVAYMCASITNKKRCSENPIECELINVTNTLSLIKTLTEKGVFVVFISSVEVFSGDRKFYRVFDQTSPSSLYGQFKEKVELELRNNKSCSIIRLTKVLDKNNPIIKRWKDALSTGKRVSAFCNVFISPVSIDYAAELIYSNGKRKVPGVFHISGSDNVTYFEVLEKIHKKYNKTKTKKIGLIRQKSNDMPLFASLDMSGSSKGKQQSIDSVISNII